MAGNDHRAGLPEARITSIIRNFQPEHIESTRMPSLGSWAATYAREIINRPQDHIDALVEAGVLEPTGVSCQHDAYVVIRPAPHHEHDWRIVGVTMTPPGQWATTLHCTRCGGAEGTQQRIFSEPLPYRGPAV